LYEATITSAAKEEAGNPLEEKTGSFTGKR